MEIDAELYHLIGRDALALVFGMGQTRIGKVKGVVELFLCEGRIGGIHHSPSLAVFLQQAVGMDAVALFLNVAEVLSMQLAVPYTIFKGVQHNVLLADVAWNLMLAVEGYGLWNLSCMLHGITEACSGDAGFSILVIMEQRVRGLYGFLQTAAQLKRGHFSHSIDYHVRSALHQYAGLVLLFPIVIMGQSAQAGLNASQYHWHIGIKLLQNAGIDNGGVFRAHVMTSIRTIGILASETSGSSVLVHHAVHATRCNAKPKTGTAKTFEVAVVSMP